MPYTDVNLTVRFKSNMDDFDSIFTFRLFFSCCCSLLRYCNLIVYATRAKLIAVCILIYGKNVNMSLPTIVINEYMLLVNYTIEL